MSVVFSDKKASVFGDTRVEMGIVDMSDGPQSFNVGGFTNVYFCSAEPQSTAVANWSKVMTKGTTAGYVSIASCATANTFQYLVIGR